jgi:hydrogenase maturation protease
MSGAPSGILVIGVGNTYRRDDAAGLQIVRQLQAEDLPGARIVEASGEGIALMELWKGVESVILVDAVSSRAVPGTVHELDARKEPIPTGFFHYSTHAFSVAEAIELAWALGQLPPEVVIYGVEGACFEAGEGLSRAVEAAVPEVARRIRKRVQKGS